MKPPFESSGGDTPTTSAPVAKAPGAAPGVSKGLPGTPDMPELPKLEDIPGVDELGKCLDGTCEALWNAVDSGLSPIEDAIGSATKAADDAKDTVTKTVGDAKDKAAKTVDDARAKAAEQLEAAKSKAQKVADEAKAKADEAVATARKALADKMAEAAGYAQQALDNPAMAWSGLQAVAARQAACAMEEANREVERLAKAATDAAETARTLPGKMADDAAAYAQARADDAMRKADAIGDSANKAYDAAKSVTSFYDKNGLDKLGECGAIPSRPEVPDALTDALEQIDKGTDEAKRAGTDLMNQFTQNQLVEQAIYDAERYKDQYGALADKTASGLTDAIPTEFPLSGTCGGPPNPFDGSMLDPDARNRYLNQQMDEMEKKGNDEVNRMMTDILKSAQP